MLTQHILVPGSFRQVGYLSGVPLQIKELFRPLAAVEANVFEPFGSHHPAFAFPIARVENFRHDVAAPELLALYGGPEADSTDSLGAFIPA